MKTSRRDFLKTTGAAIVAGAVGTLVGSNVHAGAGLGAGVKATPGEMPKGMTFLTISKKGEYSLGVKTGKGILDVKAASRVHRKRVPTTIDDVLRLGDRGLTALVQTALSSDKTPSVFLDESRIEFGPCVTNPEKILCLGFNYRKHAMETGTPIPTSPVLFTKCNNALNGHNGVIKLPTNVATKFDHEVELVVVMGKTAHRVSEADALSYVFGYCTGNDFSARDLQYKTSQFLLGKTSDGFAPIGPYLVTADQIPDPNKLKLECYVNGERRQSNNTSDMIFNVKTIISYASQHFTLKPGDIFFTGTPEGVINGKPKDKQVWLKAGDKLTTVIENLGELKFTLV
ncbi:MAG: fumarylacetoacetate hydrolase family protein [Syntrophales bacterium]|jgi:2-keto-4-pentenoate hydratase/2-oxohepta-3-ene-1,7-dioic acid hydratase in catechol pathway